MGRGFRSAAGDIADLESESDPSPVPEPLRVRVVGYSQDDKYTFSLERYFRRRRQGVDGHYCRITRSMRPGTWRNCECREGETND